MEQLTAKEWVHEQVRRTPSMAAGVAVVASFLVISSFITYSTPQEIETLPFVCNVEPPVLVPPVKLRRPKPKEPPEAERRETPTQIEDEPVLDEKLFPDIPAVNFVEIPSPVVDDRWDLFSPDPAKTLALIANQRGRPPGGGGGGGFPSSFRLRDPDRQVDKIPSDSDPKGTLNAILEGLRWLKRAQNKQTGGWSARQWGGSSSEDRGVSALALLAFLGFGCTDKAPAEFAPTVQRAVRYLVRSQRETEARGASRGSFGERMYSQALCTMALAEAYGMMGGRDLRDAAQAGLGLIAAAQSEGGGFGYAGPPDLIPELGVAAADTSVTCFQIQAIKAAMAAKLDVPEATVRRTERFLAASFNPDGSTWYRVGVSHPEWNAPPRVVSMTAAALTARLFMGHANDAADCLAQARWLAGHGHLRMPAARNYYATYYLSLAMFNMGGKHWSDWNKTFNPALRAAQVKRGADKGSWSPGGSAWGSAGGRVYTTAMACLSLEVYFRYLPTYKSL